MQLKDAIDGYWLENRSRLSQNSYPSYQWAFDLLTNYIGPDHDLKAIASDDIRRFLTYLKDEKKLAGKTRFNAWVVLSSFWSWAEREPAIKATHVIRGVVQQPTFTTKKIVPYTQAEVVAMIDACDRTASWTTRSGRTTHTPRDTALRDRAAIILLVDTGLRASELCSLKIKDFRRETGVIEVLGKGSKERIVVAEQSARKIIWRYLATRPNAKPDDPLFATRSNRHIDKNALRHLVQRVAKRVGVKGATIHRFRHTFAITFLRCGGNPIELQRILGHENMDTVNIYVNLAQSDLQDAQRRASPANAWRLK